MNGFNDLTGRSIQDFGQPSGASMAINTGS
jgi:hypothetical protein